MVRQLRHRQTKGAATVTMEPTATAPHLDSTIFYVSFEKACQKNPTEK